MSRNTRLPIAVGLALLVVSPFVAGTPQATYEASDGTLYAVSPGSVGLGSCGPIPGGYECSVDSERVVSVLDGRGCQEKRGWASCVVVNGQGDPSVRATSTLECEDHNYVLTDGAGGLCTQNNGSEMTCEQTNSTNVATATCDDGCGVISGSGKCRTEPKPEKTKE